MPCLVCSMSRARYGTVPVRCVGPFPTRSTSDLVLVATIRVCLIGSSDRSLAIISDQLGWTRFMCVTCAFRCATDEIYR